MQGTNIILGYGETLTHEHKLKRGSGDKKYPYSIEEQRPWLEAQLKELRQSSNAVPALAKPHGENVVKVTLHPTFLAKSHHPNALFAATGLRCIGSRSTSITPRKEPRANRLPEPTYTAVLFVAGREEDFDHINSLLGSQRTAKVHQEALRKLELIAPFSAIEKNYLGHEARGESRLEVVLHAAKEDQYIVAAFVAYVASLGGKADTQRMLVVSGLTFIPVNLDASQVDALGLFQFVRVVRAMPSLRMGGRPMRAIGAPSFALPTQPALDQSLRVGIFDAGVGHTSLAPWVSEVVLPGTHNTTADCFGHGNGVTSTVLFGPLDKGAAFPRPYANVRHFRCISPGITEDQGVQDIDLYNVLQNIDTVLTNQPLDFVNFSLGPYMPMDDDEVLILPPYNRTQPIV